MTARDEILRIAGLNDQSSRYFEICRAINAYRNEVAVDIGRDLLRDGLEPFLVRLVGEDNTTRVFERHAGESDNQRNPQ